MIVLSQPVPAVGDYILGDSIMISTVLIVLLVLALMGAVPAWPHSRDWGYAPSGGIGLVLLVLVILMLSGRL